MQVWHHSQYAFFYYCVSWFFSMLLINELMVDFQFYIAGAIAGHLSNVVDWVKHRYFLIWPFFNLSMHYQPEYEKYDI